VSSGPGSVRAEMVVVVVDIGVRVGEGNCGERVEGLVQEAGSSDWLA